LNRLSIEYWVRPSQFANSSVKIAALYTYRTIPILKQISQLRAWLYFLILGCFAWGSSYLWIKIGLRETDAYNLVTWRLAFACIGLWVLALTMRIPFPRDWRRLAWMAFIGLINTAIPFTLIAWGTEQVSSSLSSILNATTPLFTALLAHFWVENEHLTPNRVLGVLVGFGGVTLLSLTKDSYSANGFQLLPILAIQGGSLLYATASLITRKKLQHENPIAISAVAVTAALLVMFWLTARNSQIQFPQLLETRIAVAWLGIVGTALAYSLFYNLIKLWGPARTSLVTYVIPVVAVILGILFLNEAIHWQHWVGGILVWLGVILVNWKQLRNLLP